MSFDSPLSLLSTDVAIDLGTSNTLVWLGGRGILVDEPSVVAVRQAGSRREVVAIGSEAKQMLGRTPESITAVRPLREGVISDYELAEAMIRYFLVRTLGRRGFLKPRVAICIPHGITEVERRVVQDSARTAGAREVFLVYAPLAAALGADLPLMDPRGTLILDIGGGTSEVTVVSLGGVVASQCLRAAGDSMDQAIIAWVRQHHNMLIGERSAEAIKLEVGCARVMNDKAAILVKGRDITSGAPRQATITGRDACEALSGTVALIIEALRTTLASTPPELAADVMDSGIVLVGGGALLDGLAEVLREKTGLPVVLAPSPLRCVALGAGQALENGQVLERVAC